MKTRTKIAGLALLGLLLVGGAVWLLAPGAAPGSGDATAAPPRAGGSAPASGLAVRAGSTGGAAGPVAPGDAPSTEALPPRAGSLNDTEEDGTLTVDGSGRLVVTVDVRRLFDYYLSASGEESRDVIRARIVAALKAKLPASALDEAVALLDDYLSYKEATRSLKLPPGTDPEDLGARLEAVKRLRREHLGEAAADAFFREEEQVDAVALERRQLQKDTTLTPEERERRIAALEEKLPPEVRSQRAEAIRPLVQQAAERDLVATGASAEDLHQYRLSTVGEEATARLEALDRERAEWKQKLDAFRAKREELRSSQMDAVAREAAVQRLLVDSFSPEERLRVEALDALAAEQAQQP